MENKSKITYRQVGDYKIPNINLPSEQANIIIGKWGMLHKNYLGYFYIIVTNRDIVCRLGTNERLGVATYFRSCVP